MAHTGAAIAFDCRTKQAKLTQFVHDLAVKPLLQRCGNHAREKLFLRIGFCGIAHEPLIFGQLRIEIEGIVPAERCKFSHGARIGTIGNTGQPGQYGAV